MRRPLVWVLVLAVCALAGDGRLTLAHAESASGATSRQDCEPNGSGAFSMRRR